MSASRGGLVVGPLRLVGRVQEYSWGKVGADSRIAAFTPGYRRDAPIAEYWLGAHPKAPSEIELGDGTRMPLDAAMAQFPEDLLGRSSGAHGNTQLPFLLKVLSINPQWGLSIQVHPNSERARILHSKDPINYPDSNHKPEVGIAITPVTLLYGCKPLPRIREVIGRLPAFREAVGPERAASLQDVSVDGERGGALVRDLFTACLALPPQKTAEVSRRLEEESRGVEACAAERDVFMRLKASYGYSDHGLLALFLMNLVEVEPGKGIFIGSNIPHAYLDGDLFECMACSDNVVRAGLTPKFKDVETLSEIVDCSPEISGLISPRLEPTGFLHFDTPTREFSLRVLPHGSRTAVIASSRGPGVILSLGERASITSLSTGRQIHLSDGGGAFLPAESGDYEVATIKAAAYHVTTP